MPPLLNKGECTAKEWSAPPLYIAGARASSPLLIGLRSKTKWRRLLYPLFTRKIRSAIMKWSASAKQSGARKTKWSAQNEVEAQG
jgi:hypothetical protein